MSANTQMERCPDCGGTKLSAALVRPDGLNSMIPFRCQKPFHTWGTPAAPETPPDFKNCDECDDNESCWLAEMCWKKLGKHPMAETPRREEA